MTEQVVRETTGLKCVAYKSEWSGGSLTVSRTSDGTVTASASVYGRRKPLVYNERDAHDFWSTTPGWVE